MAGYRIDLILFYLIFCLFLGTSDSQGCDRIDACSCQNDDGVMSLKQLSSSDGTARFQATSSEMITYSWNPCQDFVGSTGPTGGCKNVAVCQVDMYKDGYPLGSQDSAHFITTSEGALQIVYSGKDNAGTSRTSHVTLICDPSKEGEFVADGEHSDMPTNYYMTLTSKYACFNEDLIGLSSGSIIIIIMLAVIVIYLVGGISYKYAVQGARGIDMIPQLEIWRSLFTLIKDGFLFLRYGCKSQAEYESVA